MDLNYKPNSIMLQKNRHNVSYTEKTVVNVPTYYRNDSGLITKKKKVNFGRE